MSQFPSGYLKLPSVQPKKYRERFETRCVREAMLSVATEYGATTIDERYQAKLRALNEVKDKALFAKEGKSLMDGFHIHILALWAKKKIPGPPTRANFEKRIKKAESLVRMLAKKGKDSTNAQKRVEDLRAEYRAAEENGTLRA